MKKRSILLMSLVAFVVAPLHAQSLAESEGTFTVTPAFVSAYMFRGVKLGGFSFQPAVEFSKGPLTLGFSANIPIDKLKTDLDYDPVNPEIDFVASYSWAIVPDLFTITPGVNMYTFPRAKESDGYYKAQLEPSISFEYTVKDMTLAFTCYYDLMMKGPTYEIGADYSIPLEYINCELEISALVGTFNWSDAVAKAGVKVKNSGNYFRFGAAVPFEFSKKSKLLAGWYFEKGTNNYYKVAGLPKISNPDAIGQGVFNVSYSFSF